MHKLVNESDKWVQTYKVMTTNKSQKPSKQNWYPSAKQFIPYI